MDYCSVSLTVHRFYLSWHGSWWFLSTLWKRRCLRCVVGDQARILITSISQILAFLQLSIFPKGWVFAGILWQFSKPLHNLCQAKQYKPDSHCGKVVVLPLLLGVTEVTLVRQNQVIRAVCYAAAMYWVADVFQRVRSIGYLNGLAISETKKNPARYYIESWKEIGWFYFSDWTF